METCVNHPDHEAVERCEVCGRALCGLCLWYGEDGRRLCEADAGSLTADGLAVTPPEAYAEAIRVTEASGAPRPDIPYQGNRLDLYGLLGAVFGGVMLASCSGLTYCLPLLAGIFGAYAYLNADRSLNPRRTRLLGGIGVVTAAIMIFFVLAILLFTLGMFALAISTSSGP